MLDSPRSDGRRQPLFSVDLWVNKYAPTSLEDLVGNGKSISDLRRWLRDWSLKNGKQRGSSSGKFGKYMTAALISGPPGIGKTSCVKIICSELKYAITEVNASDERSKAGSNILDGVKGSTSNSLRELVTNETFRSGLLGKRNHALIMDEVDGMSGGDRGGITGVIEMIKQSKIPIICICNDRFSQKLKSLQNYCEEFIFHRPSKLQICKRILFVASKEQITLEEAEVLSMIEQYDADLRLIINQLQLKTLSATPSIERDAATGLLKSHDNRPFIIVDKFFSVQSHSLPIEEKFKLAFEDPDIISLFIQENYLQMRPATFLNDLQRLQMLARASMDISSGDALGTIVRIRQNWELLPHAILYGSLVPAASMRGQREIFNLQPGERNFHRFPVWLGKNSTFLKIKRMLGVLHLRMTSSGRCKINFGTLRPNYISLIRSHLTLPLRSLPRGTKDNIEISNVLKFLTEYTMTKSDWDNLIDQIPLLHGKGVAFLPLSRDITSATKSRLTRACKNIVQIRGGLLRLNKSNSQNETSENEDDFGI